MDNRAVISTKESTDIILGNKELTTHEQMWYVAEYIHTPEGVPVGSRQVAGVFARTYRPQNDWNGRYWVTRRSFHVTKIIYTTGAADIIIFASDSNDGEIDIIRAPAPKAKLVTDPIAVIDPDEDDRDWLHTTAILKLMADSGRGNLCLYHYKDGYYEPAGWSNATCHRIPLPNDNLPDKWDYLRNLVRQIADDADIQPFTSTDGLELAWVGRRGHDVTKIELYTFDTVNRRILYRIRGCDDIFTIL